MQATGAAEDSNRMKPIGRKIRIAGIVQGVGFRPWVYRVALQSGIAGTVRNDSSGVTVEAFGGNDEIDRFVAALRSAPPPAAMIDTFEVEDLEWRSEDEFSIVGYPEDLLHRYGIDGDGIAEAIQQVMKTDFEADEDWEDEV